jgi:transcriptional regulator with XRE-family HTH domain
MSSLAFGAMPKAPATPPAHPALVQFAARLIELRKARGISQERRAMDSGVGRSYLSRVERSQRNISLINITKLAAGLGVEPYQLLERPGS